MEAAIEELMEGVEEHLTDIKGIGPVLAATIVAEIGDISPFQRLASLVRLRVCELFLRQAVGQCVACVITAQMFAVVKGTSLPVFAH